MSNAKPFAQPFQDYEIVERLGSGGMGVVFRARRKSDDRNVALKVLHPSRSRNRRYLERLRREAEISMRLDHPNLVKGLGVGEEGGYHYLVMAFVEGKSLRELLKSWGRFPEDKVREIGHQLADALRSAHEHGIVHRDVKPGNVLVSDEGVAMLTDLGLAKAETDQTVTRDGATVGTPQYMSPEQAKDPANVDPRGDLYSLGATLYHMVTGFAPFEGESVGQLVHKLMSEPLQPPSELCEELSPGFDLVLRKLLARDPELRYQSASDLIGDLHRLDAGELPRVNERALEPKRSRKPMLLRLGLSMLGIAVVVIGTLLILKDAETPTPDNAARRVEQTLIELRRVNPDSFGAQLEELERPEHVATLDEAQRSRLRSGVVELFRRRLATVLEDRFSPEAFEAWLDERGLADWRRDFLGAHIESELQRQFGLPVEEFPQKLQESYASWRRYREPLFEGVVSGRVQQLVQNIERSYEREFRPALDQLIQAWDFGEAERRLLSIREDPLGSMLDTSGRAMRIPASEQRRFGPLMEHVAEDLQRTRREAEQIVEMFVRREWMSLDAAAARAENGSTKDLEVGRTIVESTLKRLSEKTPWKSLPRGVRLDRERVLRRAEEVSAQLSRIEAQRSRALFSDVADSLHELLVQRLDVDDARRTLAQYEFSSDAVQEKVRALVEDFDQLEKGLAWIRRTLTEAGHADELWDIQGSQRIGRFVPAPTGAELNAAERARRLAFRERNRDDRILELRDLEARQVVERLRARDPEGSEKRALQLGLYLMYSDELSAAQPLLLEAGRFDDALRQRLERRSKLLAERARDVEGQLLANLESIEQALAKGEWERASKLLLLLQNFKESAAAAEHRRRIAQLEERTRRAQHLLELRGRLGAPLRGEDVLSFVGDDEATRLRLRVDVRQSLGFASGLGVWTKQGGAFVPRARPAAELERQALRERLRLALPVFDPESPSSVELELAVPGQGEPLDVLVLEWQGGRVLLAQDSQGLRCATQGLRKELMPKLSELMRGKLATATRRFVLRGTTQRLRIERSALRAGSVREWRVLLDDELLWSGEIREGRESPSDLALRIAGGFGFRVLEIRGTATN